MSHFTRGSCFACSADITDFSEQAELWAPLSIMRITCDILRGIINEVLGRENSG